jgi:hypothetical protein
VLVHVKEYDGFITLEECNVTNVQVQETVVDKHVGIVVTGVFQTMYTK